MTVRQIPSERGLRDGGCGSENPEAGPGGKGR